VRWGLNNTLAHVRRAELSARVTAGTDPCSVQLVLRRSGAGRCHFCLGTRRSDDGHATCFGGAFTLLVVCAASCAATASGSGSSPRPRSCPPFRRTLSCTAPVARPSSSPRSAPADFTPWPHLVASPCESAACIACRRCFKFWARSPYMPGFPADGTLYPLPCMRSFLELRGQGNRPPCGRACTPDRA